MSAHAVQDHYPDDFAHCYGCGRLNAHGLHVRTFWEADGTFARFTPRPEHIALPGFVYGGVIASLIDCHAIGTAAAYVEREAGRDIGDGPSPRFVTGTLTVRFLKPTPLGPELDLPLPGPGLQVRGRQGLRPGSAGPSQWVAAGSARV